MPPPSSGAALSSREAPEKQEQQQQEKSLTMVECAGVAWKRLERQALLRRQKLPKRFASFQASPMMLLWLHQVAHFFEVYFCLRQARDELEKLSEKLSEEKRSRRRRDDDDDDDDEEEEEEKSRAGGGSASPEAVSEAVCAVNKAKRNVDRATLELSSAYCEMILHCSNSRSTTSDRLFFACVMQLTLYVVDVLFPNSVFEARSELHRLLTDAAVSQKNAKREKDKDITTTRRPRSATSRKNALSLERPMKATLLPADTTESLVKKQRRAVVAIEASKNVETAERFLEAAARRFLDRADTKQQRPVAMREARHRVSPLVKRLLTRLRDPGSSGAQETNHGEEQQLKDDSMKQRPLAPPVVPRLLQTKRMEWRRRCRGKPKKNKGPDATALSAAPPTSQRKQVPSINGFEQFKDIFARRYTPGHQTSRTAVCGGFTSAKVTAARNIVNTLDQQLSARLGGAHDATMENKPKPTRPAPQTICLVEPSLSSTLTLPSPSLKITLAS